MNIISRIATSAVVLGIFSAPPMWPQTAPTATLTITGSEQQSGASWHTGSVTISVNGVSETVTYGQYSTSSSIAAGLAAEFSQDPVSALPHLCTKGLCGKANGANISFQLSTPGASFTEPSVTTTGSDFGVETSSWPANSVGTPSGISCIPAIVAFGDNTMCVVTLPAGATGPVTFTIEGTTVTSATPDQFGTAEALLDLSGETAGAYTVDYTYPGDGTTPSATGSATVTILASGQASSAPIVYMYNISQFDAVGNVVSYTDQVNGQWSNIVYDSFNRITSAKATPAMQGLAVTDFCWGYDSFGNRTSQVMSDQSITGDGAYCTPQNPASANWTGHNVVYTAANQIDHYVDPITPSQQVVPVQYEPSGNGNVITSGLDGINPIWYLYDGENRICAVRLPPPPGFSTGRIIKYIYDAEGNRVGRGTSTQSPPVDCTIDSTFQLEAEWILDQNGRQLTELNAGANWVHTNAFAGNQLVATLDTVTSQSSTYNYTNPAVHYQLSDWLGTRRMQVAPDGTMEETCQSLPFGDQLGPCVATSVATADDSTEHHFTGKERDTESGLDYFGARYYSSNMGRFSSPDPGWFLQADPSNPQSWNMYAYAMNNPLSNVDPDGYDCVYLNSAGTDVDRDANGNATGIDTNSNSGECGKNGGSWVDGTVAHIQLYSNNNDVGLNGHTTDSQGNQTSTDAFYTNASSPAAQFLLPTWGYSGLTGTIDLAKLYRNRNTNMHYLSAQNPGDVWAGCAVGGVPGLALDLSPIGIVPDALNALQGDSLNPLFNSGDTANNVGNAVDVAGKTADALSKTLPLAGPIAKRLGPVGMGISLYKYGRNTYNCAR